jgi:hypothetical protein
VSRSSPAPRGFRGTSTTFRVGQNIFDGRHFTSFARSVQRTELRCPLEGIHPSEEVPHPPASFSPCGSLDRWQVLRELREIPCQIFSPLPSPKREIKNLCPDLGDLSTTSGDERLHTNYLVASFPQRSPIVRSKIAALRDPPWTFDTFRGELPNCSFFEPAPVRVTPPPTHRRATRRGHQYLRCASPMRVIVTLDARPLHHRRLHRQPDHVVARASLRHVLEVLGAFIVSEVRRAPRIHDDRQRRLVAQRHRVAQTFAYAPTQHRDRREYVERGVLHSR